MCACVHMLCVHILYVHVHVCMCMVCVCVGVHVRMHVCACRCACAHMLCVHLRVHACVPVCIGVCTLHVHVCACACVGPPQLRRPTPGHYCWSRSRALRLTPAGSTGEGLGAWLPRAPGGVERCVCHAQSRALSPQTRAPAAASVVSPVRTPPPGPATQPLGVSPSDLACPLACCQDGEEGSWAQVRPRPGRSGRRPARRSALRRLRPHSPQLCRGLRLVVRMGVAPSGLPAPPPPRLTPFQGEQGLDGEKPCQGPVT